MKAEKKRQPLIIIDIDGTITNFRKLDQEIIRKQFSTNFAVMILDKLLWKINSLDYITNRFWIFKLRIVLYSLLSFSSFKARIAEYRGEYIKKSTHDYNTYLKKYHLTLKELGLDVLLLSHSEFACYLDSRVHSVKDKKKYVLDNVYGKYDIVYIVGNNYMDDIKLGLKLRKKRKDIGDKKFTNIVYIGSSKFLINIVLFGKKILVYDNLGRFINDLKKV